MHPQGHLRVPPIPIAQGGCYDQIREQTGLGHGVPCGTGGTTSCHPLTWSSSSRATMLAPPAPSLHQPGAHVRAGHLGKHHDKGPLPLAHWGHLGVQEGPGRGESACGLLYKSYCCTSHPRFTPAAQASPQPLLGCLRHQVPMCPPSPFPCWMGLPSAWSGPSVPPSVWSPICSPPPARLLGWWQPAAPPVGSCPCPVAPLPQQPK